MKSILSVYYHGIVHQIHRLLATIEDPQRRLKWQHIQGEIAEELDAVKNIMVSLSTFRLGSQENLAATGPRSFSYEEPTRDGSHYCVKVNHFSLVEIFHSQQIVPVNSTLLNGFSPFSLNHSMPPQHFTY